jgi:anti-anti-sigma regulatory factor
MTGRIHVHAVKPLPEKLKGAEGRLFFRELESSMKNNHPGIVLDCSELVQLDRSGALLLLCCLEAAMKRNGDVKLSAVPAGARAILKLTRLDRVFEIFDTNADALKSFGQSSVTASSLLIPPGSSIQASDAAV